MSSIAAATEVVTMRLASRCRNSPASRPCPGDEHGDEQHRGGDRGRHDEIGVALPELAGVATM
ncbi:hypothetical protein CTI14_72425, partial [Methylobacterium radiotolerans]